MTADELPKGFHVLDGKPVYDGRRDTLYLYFLIREGVVVYVGVSSGSVKNRLRDHRRGEPAFGIPPKVFDEVRYAIVPVWEIEQQEAFWIAAARPEYNRAGVTKKYQPPRRGAVMEWKRAGCPMPNPSAP